jgi:folate-binding protein YgfZ
MDLRGTLDAAANAALVVPAPERAVLAVTGGDRATWLNGLVTCDVAKIPPGKAGYGLFVMPKGRIFADVVVLAEPSRLLLSVPLAKRDELRAHLDKYLVMEDAEVADAPGLAVEMVDGPRASEVAEAMRDAGAFVGAVDRTGLGGAIAFVDAAGAGAVHAARDAALARVGGAVGDARAWEALRIERRVPELGADFDDETYPQEAGLERRAVAFDKGCYLGQEVVCMLEMRGHVKRRLVAMRVESSAPPPRGTEVKDDAGAVLGQVTSSAIVPSAGGPMVLAMVKRAKSDEGTELLVGDARVRVVGLAG